MSFLEIHLSRSSAHFSNESFAFLLLDCICCLYILEIKLLSIASFINIFSHSVGCVLLVFCFLFFNGFVCCAKAYKFD